MKYASSCELKGRTIQRLQRGQPLIAGILARVSSIVYCIRKSHSTDTLYLTIGTHTYGQSPLRSGKVKDLKPGRSDTQARDSESAVHDRGFSGHCFACVFLEALVILFGVCAEIVFERSQLGSVSLLLVLKKIPPALQ